MLTDIEIAQANEMEKITAIAEKCGLSSEDIEQYGHYKAKISFDAIRRLDAKEDGKLVLVTAITPTPAGEGKSTTSIGLVESLSAIGKKAIATLREPSLGPVFGIKGGAAGGGYAQVVPMDDINLHFTGDMHAITAAHNLLSAIIDNHIYQGNALNIDLRQITWPRVLDMNDRALRNVNVALGGKVCGFPREDHFMITVASEIMAILCLAKDLEDLKDRFGRIIIGPDMDGNPVRVSHLGCQGAMALLMKDAIKPNLVQTLEGTPALVHGGPFANIAHGCNSVVATKTALKLGDYVITEAGFGADLGAEKFFDIKCRYAGLKPDCVVIVATVRALKMNGGVAKDNLAKENLDALRAGSSNLIRHIENVAKFGVPSVVAINRFPTDTDAELELLDKICEEYGVKVVLSEVFAKGAEGGMDLAEEVVRICEEGKADFKPLYDLDLSIEEKMEKIAKEIYRADGVDFTPAAKKQIKELTKLGYDKLPICVAKTQYSFSDDATLLGAPTGFTITVRELRVSAGAGFIVALTGSIMTMPGLPKVPAANGMDILSDGTIIGLS